ncbi:MAG: hypothetical protein AAFN30_05510, partial [Actinomycetota bacterium]
MATRSTVAMGAAGPGARSERVPARTSTDSVERRSRLARWSRANNRCSRQGRLVDQQIGYIDWLEDTEDEPERLQRLFALDHLANRL